MPLFHTLITYSSAEFLEAIVSLDKVERKLLRFQFEWELAHLKNQQDFLRIQMINPKENIINIHSTLVKTKKDMDKLNSYYPLLCDLDTPKIEPYRHHPESEHIETLKKTIHTFDTQELLLLFILHRSKQIKADYRYQNAQTNASDMTLHEKIQREAAKRVLYYQYESNVQQILITMIEQRISAFTLKTAATFPQVLRNNLYDLQIKIHSKLISMRELEQLETEYVEQYRTSGSSLVELEGQLSKAENNTSDVHHLQKKHAYLVPRHQLSTLSLMNIRFKLEDMKLSQSPTEQKILQDKRSKKVIRNFFSSRIEPSATLVRSNIIFSGSTFK